MYLLVEGMNFEYENVILAFEQRRDALDYISRLPDKTNSHEYWAVLEVPLFPESSAAGVKIADRRGSDIESPVLPLK